MSKFLLRLLQSLVLGGCLLAIAIPARAQSCYLTDAQISEIKFHYNLDQYMVGGCVIGAIFGSITGLLTMSGVTVVAAVPYIATGCSTGFLIGGASAMLNSLFTATTTSTGPARGNAWNKVSP